MFRNFDPDHASSENLLTSASGSVTLAYDPALRLYQVAGGITTRFAYDGVNAIAEYDGSNALQRRFVFGPGIDQPIVQYEGTGTTDRRFMGADERGSIISLTNSAGALLNINRYDEYGAPQTTNTGRFQYTGQAWLGEVGMQYSKARMYSPTLGRFLQTDPIGYEDSPNLYAYVLDDPINLTDPLGFAKKCPAPKAGEVVVCGQRRPNPTGALNTLPRGSGPGGTLIGKIGIPPPPPQVRKLSQCMINFMNNVGVGYDWSKLRISSAEPLPGMAATNWGTIINVGGRYGNFESDKPLLFHELAHSPQWANGELSRMGYVGMSITAGAEILARGEDLSVQRIHDQLSVEQEADAVRDALLDAYKAMGKPCG